MGFQHIFKKALLFASLLLILAPAAAPCAARRLIDGDDLSVIFDEGLSAAAEETARVYPSIKADLEKTIGWKVSFKPGIVLIKDNETFGQMAGNSLIAGYALPDKRLMVIDYSRMKTDPFTLEETIKHELCHLLLHDYIPEGNLPRWLDEGVAQWASGGLADIFLEKSSVLDEAFRQGRMIGFNSISEGFPDDPDLLRLAYAQSRDFVEYLMKERQTAGLLALLGYLREGDSIDPAMRKIFSLSLDGMEKQWHGQLEKEATWISALINSLYDILFFLSALALVYGFIRVWRRKKRMLDEYEDEE
jgi:hypothetical protein